MSGKVIPDEVLESSSCQLCCKYPTVTPIHSFDGCTVCGRCHPERPSKVILHHHGDFSTHRPFEDLPLSLLGFLTNPDSRYPCVNRLEGCQQLLRLPQVPEHEQRCPYRRTTECPRCRFGGVGSQLVQHFKLQHAPFVLSGWTSFRVDLRRSFRESYLFRKGLLVCLLEMAFSEESSQCLVRTSCVTSGHRRAKIKLGLSDVYEFVVVSKQVEICDRQDYIISLKIDDVHLKETPFIVCRYDVILFN